MIQCQSQILSHTPVSDAFYELSFSWPQNAAQPLPGQFCTIRVSPFSTPLLRRPFAFSGFDKEKLAASIIYKRRGPATELLSAKHIGDSVDVIGPLGSDFITVSTRTAKTPLCVAGGTGLGPMLYLARYSLMQGGNPLVVLGCREKSQLPNAAFLDGLNMVIATDDGSRGIKGTSLDALCGLSEEAIKDRIVCGCGPMPLMRGCHAFAQEKKLDCFVSLEQTMACGVGACMGCVIKVTDLQGIGYVRACTEGPVLHSKRIAWN